MPLVATTTSRPARSRSIPAGPSLATFSTRAARRSDFARALDRAASWDSSQPRSERAAMTASSATSRERTEARPPWSTTTSATQVAMSQAWTSTSVAVAQPIATVMARKRCVPRV